MIYKVLVPEPIVVTENELGGTATTIGALIVTPRINDVLGVPDTGKTAAGADLGVMVTATTFELKFKNPA